MFFLKISTKQPKKVFSNSSSLMKPACNVFGSF